MGNINLKFYSTINLTTFWFSMILSLFRLSQVSCSSFMILVEPNSIWHHSVGNTPKDEELWSYHSLWQCWVNDLIDGGSRSNGNICSSSRRSKNAIIYGSNWRIDCCRKASLSQEKLHFICISLQVSFAYMKLCIVTL